MGRRATGRLSSHCDIDRKKEVNNRHADAKKKKLSWHLLINLLSSFFFLLIVNDTLGATPMSGLYRASAQ